MGGVDEVSHCLTLAQEEALSGLPEAERDLPMCAGHGTILAGERPATGGYRQV